MYSPATFLSLERPTLRILGAFALALAPACADDAISVSALGSGRNCPLGGVKIETPDGTYTLCNGRQDGEGGAGLEPVSTVFCASDGILAGTTVALSYSATHFSDGSVFTSCSVATSSRVTGSGAEFFASWQKGATSASCTAWGDSDPAGGLGFWAFSRAGAAVQAVYTDTGSTSDALGLTFVEADCTRTMM